MFTAARACGVYEGALRASIIALKQKPHVCRRVGLLMKELCATAPLNRATRVVPVPLHADREKERGFNQAAVLAAVAGALMELPVLHQALARTAHTERHRAGMDARARMESVEDAFDVSQPKLVAGESILLVDDVLTTGATVSACASSLRSAGAIDVFVLTLARPFHP
jgi:ComF family protein